MAVKSLDEFNSLYINELSGIKGPVGVLRAACKGAALSGADTKRKKAHPFSLISDAMFYLAIVAIFLSIISTDINSGMPRTLFGYSYFNVRSPSMQDEIPQGSLIIVKHMVPQELNAGDNITYMLDKTTSVTHKIVEIKENYLKSGARGFVTKGVNNAKPDAETVYEANIVGKVVLVVPVLGAVISSLSVNIHILIIIFGLIVIFSFCLRGMFGNS